MKYKVGDKVRVLPSAINDYAVRSIGKVLRIESLEGEWLNLENGYGVRYTNVELVNKESLRYMEVGDKVVNNAGEERKVLAVCGEAFLFRLISDFNKAHTWLTFTEGEKYGWKPKDQEAEVETV